MNKIYHIYEYLKTHKMRTKLEICEALGIVSMTLADWCRVKALATNFGDEGHSQRRVKMEGKGSQLEYNITVGAK